MSQNNGKNDVSKQTDEHIRALSPIEHVRMRPGMYVGGDDAKAMTNAAADVFYNLAPQMRRQACTSLVVAILDAKTLQVWENGQPLPIYESGTPGLSVLEMVMTRVGAVYKQDDLSVRPVGLVGAGLSVVNALSRYLTIQVIGEGGLWEQRYEKGRKVTELTRLRDVTDGDGWTTSITFTLDEEIFTDHVFDASAIENVLFTYAHVFPGLAVSFDNRLTGEYRSFYAPSGLAYYLEQENRYKQTLHPATVLMARFESTTDTHPLGFNRGNDSASFELSMAFQFLARPVPSRRSFINTHETRSHGTHVEVCIQALRDCLLGHSATIRRRDMPGLFNHLTLAVSLWHGWPTFQGSRNDRLVNRDFVQRAYEDLSVALTLYFKEHPETLEALETLALSKRPKKRSRFPALRRR